VNSLHNIIAKSNELSLTISVLKVSARVKRNDSEEDESDEDEEDDSEVSHLNSAPNSPKLAR